ncbi:hypothetical protein [Xanthomonas cannabis]|uniref:hypothetical protein n=1 Tax=Xanthomonas cannabis TaxID=1885674 RepID=UPI00141BEFFF|nr:hypothetical protein [Xanthomonas cannabis]NIK03378.1 hypothetical protein [Xanthomonas cannabis]NIK66540.1 hypothetical protein [Xanthomonas cannabis]
MIRFPPDLPVLSHQIATTASCVSRALGDLQASSLVERAVPSPLAGHAVNPSMGLGGGIHAANGPAIGEDTTLDSWLVVLWKSKDTAPPAC